MPVVAAADVPDVDVLVDVRVRRALPRRDRADRPGRRPDPRRGQRAGRAHPRQPRPLPRRRTSCARSSPARASRPTGPSRRTAAAASTPATPCWRSSWPGSRPRSTPAASAGGSPTRIGRSRPAERGSRDRSRSSRAMRAAASRSGTASAAGRPSTGGRPSPSSDGPGRIRGQSLELQRYVGEPPRAAARPGRARRALGLDVGRSRCRTAATTSAYGPRRSPRPRARRPAGLLVGLSRLARWPARGCPRPGRWTSPSRDHRGHRVHPDAVICSACTSDLGRRQHGVYEHPITGGDQGGRGRGLRPRGRRLRPASAWTSPAGRPVPRRQDRSTTG